MGSHRHATWPAVFISLGLDPVRGAATSKPLTFKRWVLDHEAFHNALAVVHGPVDLWTQRTKNPIGHSLLL